MLKIVKLRETGKKSSNFELNPIILFFEKELNKFQEWLNSLEFNPPFVYFRKKANKKEGKKLGDDDCGEMPKWIYQNLLDSYRLSNSRAIEMFGDPEEALANLRQEWKEN